MRAELRSSAARPGQLEIENGLRALLGVHHELETVFQERPHHHTHLILVRFTVRPRLNVESLVVDPAREVEQITWSQPICKAQVGDERLVGGAKPATVCYIRVSGTEWEQRRARSVGSVRFDGRDLKGGL